MPGGKAAGQPLFTALILICGNEFCGGTSPIEFNLRLVERLKPICHSPPFFRAARAQSRFLNGFNDPVKSRK